MNIQIDKSLIGKTVATIEQSPASYSPMVREDKVTGIYVDKDSHVELRLGATKWIREEYVFEPHETTKKLAEYNAKYNKRS